MVGEWLFKLLIIKFYPLSIVYLDFHDLIWILFLILWSSNSLLSLKVSMPYNANTCR